VACASALMVSAPARPRSVVPTLLPIVTAVFVVYLVIGVALPVLPVHVTTRLGFGALVVGLVTGGQFTAALLSRFWAGTYADTHGAKRAVMLGLATAAIAGLLYLVSLSLLGTASLSLAMLLIGRAVLGAAESFIVTGALAWALGLAGKENAGRVMSWVGTAMYVAFAVSAPLGTLLYARIGFAAIAVATVAIPLLAMVIAAKQPDAAPTARTKARPLEVVRAVWKPGLGLALSAVGFGAIAMFVVLLFAARGWGYAWLAFTLLSMCFAGARLVFGHLPDRIGGARCALCSAIVEAIGQALIWLAPWPWLALVGAALSGLGYALVYPGFGIEAVRAAPAENRGLAMGAYTAFLDLALALAGPTLGLVASGFGLGTVFLVSTTVVLCAAVVAMSLMRATGEST
jgi:MFS family permease